MSDSKSSNTTKPPHNGGDAPTNKPVYLDDLPPTAHPQFRAERLEQEDLGPVSVEVVLRTRTGEYACSLRNISTSGVAFQPPTSLRLAPGERLRDLAVVCDEHELYRGGGVVRTFRSVDGLDIVGASLDSPMNMDDVLQLRAVRERRKDPRLHIRPEEQPWCCKDTRGQRFQALVAEMHLFLAEAEKRVRSLEEELPWHVIHGEKVSPARLDLIAQLEQSFVPSFVDYTVRIDEAIRAVPAEHVGRMKAFSRAFIQDTLMLAPLMHRCLTKPLGYPGDYVIMRYLYEDRFEGSSLWAKALHLAGSTAPACEAVRSRKDMVGEHLVALAKDKAARGERARILSVAAGPAQETIELLSSHPELSNHLDILLFDQDRDALEFVNNRLNRLRGELGAEVAGAQVQLRHDTIKRLLEDPGIFEDFGPVDMVFSSGLFDYLRFHTGARLLENLYGTLAPGGRLLAGNIVPEQPTRWVFDMHMDWFIEYRSREELLTMGEAAARNASPRIIEERTGWNPFVELTRD